MTDAFFCNPDATLNQNERQHYKPNEAHLFEQAHEEACVELERPDRSVCLQMGVGGMVGDDHGGLIEFMTAFHPGTK